MDNILLETGDSLLQEDSGFILLETQVSAPSAYQSYTGYFTMIPKPYRGIYGFISIPVGPTLEDLAFTDVVNLTESPTFTYTRTAAGNASAKATKSLAASADGYVQYEINSTTSGNGGVGFSSNGAQSPDYAYDYLFYLDGGTGTYKTFDNTDGYVDTLIAAVTGDLVAIERIGSTFYAKYYRGGSWNAARTFTPTSSAQQYMYLTIIDVSGTQRVINPKGYNIS